MMGADRSKQEIEKIFRPAKNLFCCMRLTIIIYSMYMYSIPKLEDYIFFEGNEIVDKNLLVVAYF